MKNFGRFSFHAAIHLSHGHISFKEGDAFLQCQASALENVTKKRMPLNRSKVVFPGQQPVLHFWDVGQGRGRAEKGESASKFESTMSKHT